MPTPARARRLADRIREELAEILRREAADPRLALVTVTDVVVDREFSQATIYLSTTDPERSHEEIVQAFGRAGGFLRRELAARIQLRSFPRLQFRWDPSPEHGARIEDLLADIRRKAPGRSGNKS